MKSFRLLSGVSCAALLACTGTGSALDELATTPIVVFGEEQVDMLSARSILDMSYISSGVSVLTGGNFSIEGGGGFTLTDLVDGVDFNLGASIASEQPGGSGSAWAGIDAVFGLPGATDYQFRGRAGGALGVFSGGSIAYRGTAGGQIRLTSSTDVYAEGVLRGLVGSAPSDFGIRAGLLFYPGRFDDIERIEVLKGPQGTLFGPNTRTFIGGNVAVIPGYVIPGIEAGVIYQPPGSPFDFGGGVEHRRQLGGDWESSIGPEVGVTLAPNMRLFGQAKVGTIGGTFTTNTLALGGELFLNSNLSAVLKGFSRGAIGTFTEYGIEGGLRYSFGGVGNTAVDYPIDAPANIAIEGVTPYIGTSMSFVPGGTFIPAVNGRLDFETSYGLKPSLQAELSYFYPSGYIGAFVGGRVAYPLTATVDLFGAADIGTINSSGPYNRIEAGIEAEVFNGLYLSGSAFGQGPLGHVVEGGLKIGVGFELDDVLGERNPQF